MLLLMVRAGVRTLFFLNVMRRWRLHETTSPRRRLQGHARVHASRHGDGNGSQHAGAAAARFGVKVGERVWRVNGRAVGEALDFNGVVGLCRQRPVALDLVDAEA